MTRDSDTASSSGNSVESMESPVINASEVFPTDADISGIEVIPPEEDVDPKTVVLMIGAL